MNNDFQTPHWGWWSIILVGMSLTAWIAFNDTVFALWQNGITALLPQVVFQWIFWAALLTHVGEALYAVRLAQHTKRSHALLWGFQTFLLGYPSLRLLKIQS